MKKKINVSVGELVERMLRSGDLHFGASVINNPLDSIRAHKTIQRSRSGEYRAEWVVSHQFETDSFILETSGRIDGVLKYNERVIIEEIKTTRRDLESFKKDENLLHWGQLKTYAYIYSAQEGLEEIDCRMTYYHLDSGRTIEIDRHFKRDELFQFYREIALGFIEREKAEAERRQNRDKSFKALEFPFPSYRRGQRKMAVEVYRTIKDSGQLLVQASTGIGKTMAVIFPALKAMAEEFISKIFYLTARTTGKDIAEEAIDELRSKGLRLRSVTLTAKDRICPKPETTCSAEECDCARGYHDRIEEALQEIIRHDAMTRELIEQTAGKYTVCPFELSLELAFWADIIICDYNYVFDPRVFLRSLFSERRKEYLFLIDEAHNLVERSREMFSAQIHKQTFLDTRRGLKDALPFIYRDMGRINSSMVRLGKSCKEAGNYLTQDERPMRLIPLLKKFSEDTEEWLSLNIKTPFRKDLADLYFAVRGFLMVEDNYDESFTTIFEKTNKDLRLKLFCMDASSPMKKILRRCRAAVFFSATMTPPDYFRKVLGCGESAKLIVIPSPFPADNLCLMVIDSVSTLYRHREETRHRIWDIIGPALKYRKGNYMVFFPSYEYMKMIHSIIETQNSEVNIIMQRPGMTEEERDEFLGMFRPENGHDMTGFAVMGGIFGEGIDLVGERLSGAIILGVGLPAISPERELIRKYFSGQGKNGFEYAYLFPGINRVLQAAGRVIRTAEDMGIVMLIDRRFSFKRYRDLFPKDWNPVLVRALPEMKEVMERFWNNYSS